MGWGDVGGEQQYLFCYLYKPGQTGSYPSLISIMHSTNCKRSVRRNSVALALYAKKRTAGSNLVGVTTLVGSRWQHQNGANYSCAILFIMWKLWEPQDRRQNIDLSNIPGAGWHCRQGDIFSNQHSSLLTYSSTASTWMKQITWELQKTQDKRRMFLITKHCPVLLISPTSICSGTGLQLLYICKSSSGLQPKK